MQHVVRGRGSLNETNIASLMEALYMYRPLLVCGKRMAQTFAERVGLDVPVFSGYHPNPDLADCEAGAEMYRALGCDGLISLGGGSAMDTAKAIKALLLTGDMDAVKRSDLPSDTWLPHIAVPGTAGTGAEATPIGVVYVNDEKLSLDHPVLLPEAVVLDGSLLDIIKVVGTALIGCIGMSCGMQGWYFSGRRKISMPLRLIVIAGGLCMMIASDITSIVGLVILIGLAVFERGRTAKLSAA